MINQRLFFALDINESDKQAIAQWREQYLPLSCKPIAKENFHITLAFLGHCTASQQQALIAAADKISHSIKASCIEPLNLQTLGYFKKPQVLYLSLARCPNWLTLLATSLSNIAHAQSAFPDHSAYRPHLSLFRKAKALPKNTFCLNRSITVKSFSLYLSESTNNGVFYTPIKHWVIAS